MSPTERERHPAETVWELYGGSTYAVAYALLGDEDSAGAAVSAGLGAACAPGAGSAYGGRVTRADAVGAVFHRCRAALAASGKIRAPRSRALAWMSRTAAQQRHCLVLCVYGHLTYREAAELLGLEPAAAAELLVSGLRDIRLRQRRGRT